MNMSRPACQSVVGGLSCSGQFTQGFDGMLSHHGQIMASQADLQPSHTVSNDRVVEKLETTEHILKKMDRKVDKLQKEKHAYAKQLKKLTKRLSSSVSASRDGMIFSARNSFYPSSKKIQKNREVGDSEINLNLSDTNKTPKAKSKIKSKGNSRYNQIPKQIVVNKKESPKYTKMFGKYEQEREINVNSSIEKTSNNFTAVNTSMVKHAVASPGDDSNDYDDDMDESVPFSKHLCSDKENQNTLKEHTINNKERFMIKKPRKLVKTNRSDFSNPRKNILDYHSNPKVLKNVRKMV